MDKIKSRKELMGMALIPLSLYWEELYQSGAHAKHLDKVQSVIDTKRERAIRKLRAIVDAKRGTDNG